eukprot:Awhi_evm1s305
MTYNDEDEDRVDLLGHTYQPPSKLEKLKKKILYSFVPSLLSADDFNTPSFYSDAHCMKIDAPISLSCHEKGICPKCYHNPFVQSKFVEKEIEDSTPATAITNTTDHNINTSNVNIPKNETDSMNTNDKKISSFNDKDGGDDIEGDEKAFILVQKEKQMIIDLSNEYIGLMTEFFPPDIRRSDNSIYSGNSGMAFFHLRMYFAKKNKDICTVDHGNNDDSQDNDYDNYKNNDDGKASNSGNENVASPTNKKAKKKAPSEREEQIDILNRKATAHQQRRRRKSIKQRRKYQKLNRREHTNSSPKKCLSSQDHLQLAKEY